MKKYGLLVVSTFLVHCAGVLAYFFFIILRDGEIIFGEPTRPILTAEFVMAVVWTLVGIFFMVVAISGLFKRTGEGQLVKTSNKWPEFREYALQKYPELDEDLITMIEDLIERRREKT